MKRIAQRHGRSAAQVLLRHALQHGTATVAADFGELLVEIGRMSLKLWWIIIGLNCKYIITHAYIYPIYIYTHYTHTHNTRVRIIAIRFDCYHVVSIVIRRIYTHKYIYIGYAVMLDYANYVINKWAVLCA